MKIIKSKPYGVIADKRPEDGVMSVQLLRKSNWRFVPLTCGIFMGLVLLVVDPLLAGAPWWTYPEADLWVALLFPLAPWLGCAGLMTWLGFVLSARLSVVLISLVSIFVGIIPSVFWRLLLSDAFPESGSLELSLNLSLAAGAIALPLSTFILVKTVLSR